MKGVDDLLPGTRFVCAGRVTSRPKFRRRLTWHPVCMGRPCHFPTDQVPRTSYMAPGLYGPTMPLPDPSSGDLLPGTQSVWAGRATSRPKFRRALYLAPGLYVPAVPLPDPSSDDVLPGTRSVRAGRTTSRPKFRRTSLPGTHPVCRGRPCHFPIDQLPTTSYLAPGLYVPAVPLPDPSSDGPPLSCANWRVV